MNCNGKGNLQLSVVWKCDETSEQVCKIPWNRNLYHPPGEKDYSRNRAHGLLYFQAGCSSEFIFTALLCCCRANRTTEGREGAAPPHNLSLSGPSTQAAPLWGKTGRGDQTHMLQCDPLKSAHSMPWVRWPASSGRREAVCLCSPASECSLRCIFSQFACTFTESTHHSFINSFKNSAFTEPPLSVIF